MYYYISIIKYYDTGGHNSVSTGLNFGYNHI